MNRFPWHTLLEWYTLNGRHSLPWRDYTQKQDVLLYRVWLSEVLLQQTQVERVIPYFLRILEKYPNIASLAVANYEEFFPYYQGMGYYSRARNILKTAHRVTEEYAGIFPRDISLLQKLPGVGLYTSAAILAFGYGEPYLAWDTNLEKVFARYYHGSRLDKLSEVEKREIEEDFRNFCTSKTISSSCGTEGSIQDSTSLDPSFHSGGRSNSNSSKKGLCITSPLAITKGVIVRAINNALMDFAATVDLKNPANIDWENYPIQSGVFYENRGKSEPIEMKKSVSFPIPDATVIVVLHKDHKVYYTPITPSKSVVSSHTQEGQELKNNTTGYHPFILPPALTRDTRKYIQDTFRHTYGLELSVRPIHKKWIDVDGKPFVLVHAQIQTGIHTFHEFDKKAYLSYQKSI